MYTIFFWNTLKSVKFETVNDMTKDQFTPMM